MKKKLFALGLCFALTTALSAGSVAAAHEAKNPYEEEVKIAYLPNRAGDTTAAAWGIGIQNVLDMYPNIQYQVFDGEGTLEKQLQQLSDVITQQYDAVIIQCVDQAGESNAVQEVVDEGIPVISMNLNPTVPHAACFTLSGYNAGQAMAAKAMELAGSGNWVYISPPPEVVQAVKDAPWVGFTDAVNAAGDQFTLLETQAGDWTTETSNAIMRDMLTKYPDIKMVYAQGDEQAVGAALACQAAGREDVQIWGFDGNDQMLEYISKGVTTGTGFVNYWQMGETAATFALYAISSSVDLNAQDDIRYVFQPVTVVTKDNVEEIKALVEKYQ